jgi:hypothetical protein
VNVSVWLVNESAGQPSFLWVMHARIGPGWHLREFAAFPLKGLPVTEWCSRSGAHLIRLSDPLIRTTAVIAVNLKSASYLSVTGLPDNGPTGLHSGGEMKNSHHFKTKTLKPENHFIMLLIWQQPFCSGMHESFKTTMMKRRIY